MKRTQVYMENDVWKVLQVRAKESHSTISELVRKAVREKYFDKATHRKEALLAAVGLWKDRTDIPEGKRTSGISAKDDRLKRIWK